MNATSPPPLPIAPRPGWWQRHWRWAVPLLCLLCLGLFVGIVLLFISVLFGAMRSSDVYTFAIQRMRDNPQVVEALGSPIEPAWYLSGELNVSGASGDAQLQIPISGPKNEGDLYIEAEKSAGEWKYSTLAVTVDGRIVPIDLLLESPDNNVSR